MRKRKEERGEGTRGGKKRGGERERKRRVGNKKEMCWVDAKTEEKRR